MSGPGYAVVIRLRFQDENPWLALACTTYLPEQVLAYLDEVRRGHLTLCGAFKKQKINPDRGLNPGPTDIMADSDVEVCCATTALPGHSENRFSPRYGLIGKAVAMRTHEQHPPHHRLHRGARSIRPL
jgi:hypothetical protein